MSCFAGAPGRWSQWISLTKMNAGASVAHAESMLDTSFRHLEQPYIKKWEKNGTGRYQRPDVSDHMTVGTMQIHHHIIVMTFS